MHTDVSQRKQSGDILIAANRHWKSLQVNIIYAAYTAWPKQEVGFPYMAVQTVQTQTFYCTSIHYRVRSGHSQTSLYIA